MKKIISLGALFMAVLMLAGCAAAKGEGSGFEHILDGLTKPTDKPVISTGAPAGIETPAPLKNVPAWEHVRLGGGAEIRNGFTVYTDLESFERAFRDTAVDTSKYSERSFGGSVIVAVYMTTRTGGWTFEPERVTVVDGVLDILIRATAPVNMATQAFEDHVVLIAVDRAVYTDGMEIRIDCPGFFGLGNGEAY
ncbi:MAG: hypothetical protein K6F68_00750 [Clostridiales bacterium]|nr:hypothetical protein [Clostridiales bacterium]